MVTLASGMIRGCMVSPTTVSQEHGDLSHAGLVNIGVHIGLMALDWIFMSVDSCQNKKPADQCHMTILWAQTFISEDVY